MGIKYEGDEIFTPVIRAAIEEGLSGESLWKLADVLLGKLLEFGWNNAETALSEFEDNPYVVAAFRKHDFLLDCASEHDSEGWWCAGERGHYPVSPHRDFQGNTWTEEEEME